MIIAEVAGGLANQMIIYAAARALAIHKNVELKLDLSALNKDKTYKYYLHNLNISAELASPDEIAKIRQSSKMKIVEKIKNKLRKKLKIKVPYIYREPLCSYDDSFWSLPDDVYIGGNFISTKYFDKINDILIKEFAVKTALSSKTEEVCETIKNCESVSIHVRRGDFASNPHTNEFHGLVDVDRRELRHRLHVLRKVRAGDLGLHGRKVVLAHVHVVRLLVGLVELVLPARPCGHVPLGDLVRLDDAVLAACFDGHVADREPSGHGQLLDRLAGELHGPIECSVHADIADGAKDDVLAAHPLAELSFIDELHALGHLEPGLARDHGRGDIGAALRRCRCGCPPRSPRRREPRAPAPEVARAPRPSGPPRNKARDYAPARTGAEGCTAPRTQCPCSARNGRGSARSDRDRTPSLHRLPGIP